MLRGQMYFLYVDDVHISPETHLRASTADCGEQIYFLYVCDNRTAQETSIYLLGVLRRLLYFLYVDDVHTSQETHLQTSTAC
jgi:hypothetical protein